MQIHDKTSPRPIYLFLSKNKYIKKPITYNRFYQTACECNKIYIFGGSNQLIHEKALYQGMF